MHLPYISLDYNMLQRRDYVFFMIEFLVLSLSVLAMVSTQYKCIKINMSTET